MRGRLLAALVIVGLACVPAAAQEVRSGSGAVLRGLDRLSGDLSDLEIEAGRTKRLGRLAITLSDCRYPVNNPAGDAFAYLVIDDTAMGTPLFSGWMFASSPALNALDHMRYDIWVLRCSTA